MTTGTGDTYFDRGRAAKMFHEYIGSAPIDQINEIDTWVQIHKGRDLSDDTVDLIVDLVLNQNPDSVVTREVLASVVRIEHKATALEDLLKKRLMESAKE